MKSKKTKKSSSHSKSMKDMTWQDFVKITIFKPVKEKPIPIKWKK